MSNSPSNQPVVPPSFETANARRGGGTQRAPELPGKPSKPVGIPDSYWGAQAAKYQELLTMLPVIQLVIGLPEISPEQIAGMPEDKVRELHNERLSLIISTFKIVTERLRKEL